MQSSGCDQVHSVRVALFFVSFFFPGDCSIPKSLDECKITRYRFIGLHAMFFFFFLYQKASCASKHERSSYKPTILMGSGFLVDASQGFVS